jgi:hypothetical protein
MDNADISVPVKSIAFLVIVESIMVERGNIFYWRRKKSLRNFPLAESLCPN